MSAIAAAIAGSAIIGAVSASKQSDALNNAANAAKSTPPDLTGAYLAGIQADMSTLPLRLQVSQAASGGGVYTDPQSGQVYDFRGSFDPVRFFQENPGAYDYYIEESKATGNPPRADVEGFAKDYFGGQGLQGPAVDAKLQQYNTSSPTYKNQTDAQNQAQKTNAGTQLAITTAQQQQDALAGGSVDKNDYSAYVKNNPDLLAAYQANSNGLSMSDWGKQHYQAYGQNEGRAMPTTGLAGQANDLNLKLQNDALDAQIAGSGKATTAAVDLQNKLLPGVNDVLRDQQGKTYTANLAANQQGFNQNLDQSDQAANRSLQQQQNILPQLNNLGIQLQTDTLKGADAAGRAVNGGTYAVRDQLAQNILDALKSGDALTPAQKNKVDQQIRGAQAARGNILGDGAAFDEAIAESDYAQNQGAQRRADALNLINSKDLTPNFSSVGVVNPTQVVSPNNSAANFQTQTSINSIQPNFSATTVAAPNLTPNVAPTTDPLALLNANAGTNGQNAAMSAWTTNTNNNFAAATQAANAPNPWLQSLGLGLQAYSAFKPGGLTGVAPASSLGSSTGVASNFVCWVAREVLGTEDGKWELFREWLLTHAPAQFRMRYYRQGERFAAWLRDKPGIRALLRPFFEARAAEMEGLT